MSTKLVAVTLKGVSAKATNLDKVDIARLRWMPLTDLSFNGMRFLHHSFELEVGQALATFQRLVTDLATDLWRIENPDRERLPKRFTEDTKLRFSTLKEGSTTLPLEVPVEANEDSLFGERPSPYVERAVELLIEAIKSQENHHELPPKFPRQRISRVIELGQTLQDSESISIGNGRVPNHATLSSDTRQRFRHYLNSCYEDVLTLYGELRAVDLDGPVAHLRLPDYTRVPVAFAIDQEAMFKRLNGQPVALEGLAEISKIDGYIKRVKTVTEISPIEPVIEAGDDDPLLLWLRTPAIIEAWSVLPADASINLDKYLYGDPTK